MSLLISIALAALHVAGSGNLPDQAKSMMGWHYVGPGTYSRAPIQIPKAHFALAALQFYVYA